MPVAKLIIRLNETFQTEPNDSARERASIYCEELIRRFEPLLRVLWRKVSFATEYQDFVQDVFVKLFGNLKYLKNPKAFPGYFRQIVVSVAIDYTRKQSSYKTVHLNTISSLTNRIDEQIFTGIFIRSYLEQLSPSEREILLLEFFEGYKPAEIAVILKLKPVNVRVIKHRALSSLRKLIQTDLLTSEKDLP